MSREHLRLPMHGRDHLPGGSDPIPQIASATQLSHKEGRYQIPGTGAVTISGGSGVDVEWSLISGDALLNLTVPAGPKAITAGWYTVDITWSSTTTGWTVGAVHQGTLKMWQAAGAHVKTMRGSMVVGANDLPSAGNTPVMQGFVSLTGWLAANDMITFHIDNLDNAAHDMTVDSAEVSLLYI